ncbi:MAG: hypothetical protein PHW13_12300 [Methylococcales bacterium]|nr:hypothetical protein [Methylococcales bacterium]
MAIDEAGLYRYTADTPASIIWSGGLRRTARFNAARSSQTLICFARSARPNIWIAK